MSWPWNPGQRSLKVIENYTIQSGTHDFLLTFHSNHRPSRTVSEINGDVRRKSHENRQFWSDADNRLDASRSTNMVPPVYLTAPLKGFPLEFGIVVRGPKCLNDGLPDGPKSFKIGFVVLIQYRLWQTATHPATHPPSHVAVAIRLCASHRAQKWKVQGTQLSMTNRATHLCKRNVVAEFLKTRPSPYVLPCRIWSFCVKGCSHKYRRIPKIGERWDGRRGLPQDTRRSSICVTTSNLVVLHQRVYE